MLSLSSRLLPALRRILPVAAFALLAGTSAPALLAGASAPAAAASSNGEFVSLSRAGGWDVRANNFACMARKDFPNETRLVFVINADGDGRIMIRNDRWAIPKGDYPVTISVDRAAPIPLTGEGDEVLVSMWWDVTPDLINLFSYGAVLKATVGKAEYYYNLAGSADMMASLGRCAGDRMALRNPFAGQPPAANKPAVSNPFVGM